MNDAVHLAAPGVKRTTLNNLDIGTARGSGFTKQRDAPLNWNSSGAHRRSGTTAPRGPHVGAKAKFRRHRKPTRLT
eukprot:6795722-Pyramimonas_sp.AAC.1